MRDHTALLAFVGNLIAFAVALSPAPAIAADAVKAPSVLAHSEKLRQDLKGDSSFSAKQKQLRSLESKLKQELKDFEKKSPQQGSDDEQKVALLYYSLEPLLKGLSQAPSAKECERLRHQVELEDKGSKPETTSLTPEANEAMKWIPVFCSKN